MNAQRILPPLRRGLSLVLLATLAGCSSDTLYKQNRQRLDAAWGHLQSGDNEKALAPADRLLAETSMDSSTYSVQRYFAEVILALAHADAAYGDAFILDPETRKGISAAHVTAQRMHTGIAAGWVDSVRSKKLKADGTDLVPAELASLTVDGAARRLEYLELASFSRLGFSNRVGRILSRWPDNSITLANVEAQLDELNVEDAAHPWIYRLLFEHLSGTMDRVQAQEAYRFAIRATDPERNADYRLPGKIQTRIIEWVRQNDIWEFVSPDGTEMANPQLPESLNGIPTIEFVPRKKR